jgi:hypothetical protein
MSDRVRVLLVSCWVASAGCGSPYQTFPQVGDVNADLGARDAAPGAGTPIPSMIATNNLQLWLTADQGLTCVVGGDGLHHVARWADQSSHGRDGTPTAADQGPLCGSDGYTAPNGQPVLDFPGGTSDFTYGTLDIDLSFLVGTDYTVFVVESRSSGKIRSYLMGGLRPDQTNPPNCAANTDQAFHFGYRDSTTFTADHYCIVTDATVPDYGGNAQNEPYFLSATVFSQGAGHTLYRDGTALASLGDTTPLQRNDNGAIGRAFSITVSDTRYVGAIAEVIVYDRALSAADRKAVEAYLDQHWGL